jgi:hypothetical protein
MRKSVNVGRCARFMVACVHLSLLAACGGDRAEEPSAQTLIRTGMASPASAENYAWVSQPLLVRQDGSASRRIAVVDPATRQVVRVIDTDVAFNAVSGGHAFALSADGSTLTNLGDSTLYYLSGGQLHALDLAKAGSLLSRVVSSLSDACSIEKIEGLDYAGTAHWLEVVTAGPDGHCGSGVDGFVDNKRHLIRSDLSPSDAPSTLVIDWRGVAAFHRDRQGRLTHALVWDQASSELTLVSATDGTARGLGVNDALVGFGQYTPTVDQGNPDVTLVQTGGEWRALLWRGDVAQWASEPAGTQDGSSNPFMLPFAADEQSTFVADGRQIKRIDARGVGSIWLTLPADRGEAIRSLTLTPTHMLVIQTDGASFWVQAIRRSDLRTQVINTDRLINEPQVAYTNGNTVILREQDGQWTSRLWRLDLAGTALLHELASGVVSWVINVEPLSKVAGGSVDIAQVAWLVPNADMTALQSATVTLYDLRTQRITHPAIGLQGVELAHVGLWPAPALSAMLMTQAVGEGAPRRWWWIDTRQALGTELFLTP